MTSNSCGMSLACGPTARVRGQAHARQKHHVDETVAGIAGAQLERSRPVIADRTLLRDIARCRLMGKALRAS